MIPDDNFTPPAPKMGGAEAVANDDDHEPHTFLYLPDLTMETGWSTHRVPEREPERRSERRPAGFHRRGA